MENRYVKDGKENRLSLNIVFAIPKLEILEKSELSSDLTSGTNFSVSYLRISSDWSILEQLPNKIESNLSQ